MSEESANVSRIDRDSVTINTVFVPAKDGKCVICERPASWKYIEGPVTYKTTEKLAFPNWDDYDGELWCERCYKVYKLEGLHEQLEQAEERLREYDRTHNS